MQLPEASHPRIPSAALCRYCCLASRVTAFSAFLACLARQKRNETLACQKRNETIESMMAAQWDNETRMARRKKEEVEQVGRYGKEEGQGKRRPPLLAWRREGKGGMLKCAVREAPNFPCAAVLKCSRLDSWAQLQQTWLAYALETLNPYPKLSTPTAWDSIPYRLSEVRDETATVNFCARSISPPFCGRWAMSDALLLRGSCGLLFRLTLFL